MHVNIQISKEDFRVNSVRKRMGTFAKTKKKKKNLNNLPQGKIETSQYGQKRLKYTYIEQKNAETRTRND